jgi:diketogulonate reductase-like aldo/keto reductase
MMEAARPRSPETPHMLKRPIPSSGELLPVVGCGTWQAFDVGTAPSARAPLRDVLGALVEGGGSLIDTSPMYGAAEQVVGDLVAETGLRDKTFIATKVWTQGRGAGEAQMQRSAELLKSDPVDLIQIHNLVDWRTQLATLRARKEEGRVRYIGITHYTTSAHAELAALIRAEKLDFVQFNYALDERGAEEELLPLTAARGVATLINRPLGQGALVKRLAHRKLPDFAAELGCTDWAGLALKYILANEAVTCIVPATRRPEHMRENAAAGSGELPDAEMRRRIIVAAGV